MAREEMAEAEDAMAGMADGFRAAMWDAFADGVHPAEVMRRFFQQVRWSRPERLEGMGVWERLMVVDAGAMARQWRAAAAVDKERAEWTEAQLETWRRKGPGRVVRSAPTPAPKWDAEGPEFREGVGQWVDRAWCLGPGLRWAVRGVFVLASRLAPAALPMGVAEMACVFGTKKTHPDRWAKKVLGDTGVRARDQKRSLSCERMSAAQEGNTNRHNGSKKEQILR